MSPQPHTMSYGINPDTKQDRQNIQRIFSPQSISRIDEQRCHSRSRERNLLHQNQHFAHCQNKSCVKKRRPHPSNDKKIRNQCISGQQNIFHPLQNVPWIVTQKSGSHQNDNGKIDKILQYILFFHCSPYILQRRLVSYVTYTASLGFPMCSLL